MIVVDASVFVELMTKGPKCQALRRALFGESRILLVPHLFDIEVTNALRQLSTAGKIDSHSSQQAMEELGAFPAERSPHTPMLDRVWELRHNFTAYDAVYLALSEITGSVLYTCDAKLRKGHRAEVIVF